MADGPPVDIAQKPAPTEPKVVVRDIPGGTPKSDETTAVDGEQTPSGEAPTTAEAAAPKSEVVDDLEERQAEHADPEDTLEELASGKLDDGQKEPQVAKTGTSVPDAEHTVQDPEGTVVSEPDQPTTETASETTGSAYEPKQKADTSSTDGEGTDKAKTKPDTRDDTDTQPTPEKKKEAELTLRELHQLALVKGDEADKNGDTELGDKYRETAYRIATTEQAIAEAGTNTPLDKPEYRPQDGESIAEFFARKSEEHAKLAQDSSNGLSKLDENFSKRLAFMSEFINESQADPGSARTILAEEAKTADNPKKPDTDDSSDKDEKTDSDTDDNGDEDEEDEDEEDEDEKDDDEKDGEEEEKTLEERHKEALKKLIDLDVDVNSVAAQKLLEEAKTDPAVMDNLETIIQLTDKKVEDLKNMLNATLDAETIAKLGTKEFYSLLDLLTAAEQVAGPQQKEKMSLLKKILLTTGIIIAIPTAITIAGTAYVMKSEPPAR